MARFEYQARDSKGRWHTAAGFDCAAAARRFAYQDHQAPSRVVDRKAKAVIWRDEYRSAGGEEYD